MKKDPKKTNTPPSKPTPDVKKKFSSVYPKLASGYSNKENQEKNLNAETTENSEMLKNPDFRTEENISIEDSLNNYYSIYVDNDLYEHQAD